MSRVTQGAHMRQRDRIVSAAMCVSALLYVPQAAPANVFSVNGADPRRYLDRADTWWPLLLPVAAVSSDFSLQARGVIGNVSPGIGTAFMVSPCYAMTSYHVLFGRTATTLNPMARYPVTLRFGSNDTTMPTMTVKGRVRYWSGGDAATPDVALILVDRCPGARLGWYDLADDVTTDAVTMPSVSHDRSLRRLSVQHNCHIRGHLPSSGWLLHDCASREGASGAPLLTMRDGVPVVVGVNAGEFDATSEMRPAWDERHANWAVAADNVRRIALVSAVIARDRARAPRANLLSPYR